MSQKEKLIKRLLSKPKDFTFDEVVTLLTYMDYEMSEGNGSRVTFACDGRKTIYIHRPHPNNELLEYQVNGIIKKLKGEELI